MALGEAKDEQKWSDEVWKENSDLRIQQERDLDLWGDYEFTMPKSEGRWDNRTTNSPKITANKMLQVHTASDLQLYIDDEGDGDGSVDEKKQAREKISNTERLVIGSIAKADDLAVAVPSGKRSVDSFATYAVLLGGIAQSLLWLKDESGKPFCDMKVYNPMFCQWEEGEEGLLKFCFRNYVSRAFVERAYPDAIKKKMFDFLKVLNPWASSDKQRYLSYLFFDENSWKTSINGEYVEEEEHGLGYVPVNVKTCGPVPYLPASSESGSNNQKLSWMSYAVNTREVYDLLSRLLTIESSVATESGKRLIMTEYDSTGGGEPAQVQDLGFGAGHRNIFVNFDAADKQKFLGFAEAPGNQVTAPFRAAVRQEMDLGASLDPVVSGRLDQGGSGNYANTLIQASLEFMNFSRVCIEEAFKWRANECSRQFVFRKFPEIEVRGLNRKRGERFHTKLKASDVVESRFECKLVPDKLRNKIQEIGAALEVVRGDLMSPGTAMTEFNLVQNPDKELEKIAMSKAARLAQIDPVYHNMEMAKFYKDKKGSEETGDITSEQMAGYHGALVLIAINETIQKAAGLGMTGEPPPGQPPPSGGMGAPPMVSPQAQVGAIAAEPRNMGG
mgnify:CR=1 FL=1